LNTYVRKEACPLNLCPTTSSTVTLALGDALAMALLVLRKVDRSTFLLYHPSGNLGRVLSLRVEDIMINKDDLLIYSHKFEIPELVFNMTKKQIGFAVIVDTNFDVIGIITDGDIRRSLEKKDLMTNVDAGKLIHTNPVCISKDMLVRDAYELMKTKNISCVLITENKKLLGAIDFKEILRSGITI
jgi:arabinose-5-phosphate isomerase